MSDQHDGPRPMDAVLLGQLWKRGFRVDPLLRRQQSEHVDRAPEQPAWLDAAQQRARQRGSLIRFFPDARLEVR